MKDIIKVIILIFLIYIEENSGTAGLNTPNKKDSSNPEENNLTANKTEQSNPKTEGGSKEFENDVKELCKRLVDEVGGVGDTNECVQALRKYLPTSKTSVRVLLEENEMIELRSYAGLVSILENNHLLVEKACEDVNATNIQDCKTALHLLLVVQAVEKSTLTLLALKHKTYEDLLYAVTSNHHLAKEICRGHQTSIEKCTYEVQDLGMRFDLNHKALHKVVTKDLQPGKLTRDVKKIYKEVLKWAKKEKINSKTFITYMVNTLLARIIDENTLNKITNIKCWHSFIEEFEKFIHTADSKCKENKDLKCSQNEIANILKENTFILES